MNPIGWFSSWQKWIVPLLWIALASVLVFWPFDARLSNIDKINYAIVFSIGITVGVTEMMARYQDAPFSPLLSLPGIFYFAINGGAAITAYYLVHVMDTPVPGEGASKEVYRVIFAGLGAMAFFRSGLFTVPIGGQDVAIGPNLILQILLKALDRAYDRDRAKPRSEMVSQIMGGVSLVSARTALPLICFGLMQNITDEEREKFGSQIKEIDPLVEMDDEAKVLTIGLWLLNLVGESTLRSAVNVLGPTVQGFRVVEPALLLRLAAIGNQCAVESLPVVCNELSHASLKADDPVALVAAVVALSLPDDNKAILVLYKLVNRYGMATVSAAIGALAPTAAPPPPPPPSVS